MRLIDLTGHGSKVVPMGTVSRLLEKTCVKQVMRLGS